MILFDALTLEHGMNLRQRMLLETAAMVHEIGMFIKGSGHNLHGQYIITNSEIFGLKREEMDIIGNVVRYHRGKSPAVEDADYGALDRGDRILVLKMAAIIRVADALDRGHSQQIQQITVEKRGETMVLRTDGNRDLSLELIGIEEKGGLFQDVFGYKIMVSCWTQTTQMMATLLFLIGSFRGSILTGGFSRKGSTPTARRWSGLSSWRLPLPTSMSFLWFGWRR